MPVLTEPALPPGSLRGRAQPTLPQPCGLLLRPWRADDAAAVKDAFDCPQIQRWHVRRMDSLDEAAAWAEAWSLRWRAEADASWAVVGEDDRPLGQVGLRSVDLVEGSASLSYWVAPHARGAGAAARTTRALVRWALDDLGLHRVFAEHSTANPASCRTAVTAGLRPEGTRRGAALHADGWHDMHVHSRLRTDPWG